MKLLILIMAFFASSALASSESQQGYYWSINNNLSTNASTALESASLRCQSITSFPLCSSVSVDNNRVFENSAWYRLNLSNGQTSVAFEVSRYSCTDLSSNVPSCQPDPNICADGLPPNLNGYLGCDRPNLQQCDDGSYILASSICSISPPVCTDYESCLLYAQSQVDCSTGQNLEFNFESSQNWTYSCDLSDDSQPDFFGCSQEVCGGIAYFDFTEDDNSDGGSDDNSDGGSDDNSDGGSDDNSDGGSDDN